GSADAARTEDAERLAPDIGADELIEVPAFPLAGAGERIAFNQAPRDAHEESPGKIRGRFIEYAWRVAGRDVATRAGIQINIVKSHCNIGDCAQARTSREEFIVNSFGQKADQAVFVRDAPQDFGPRWAVRIAPIFHVKVFRELRPRLFEQAMSGEYLGPIHWELNRKARREINISAGLPRKSKTAQRRFNKRSSALASNIPACSCVPREDITVPARTGLERFCTKSGPELQAD